MGAVQVHRVAVAIAFAALIGTAHADQVGPAPKSIAIAVIDLRADADDAARTDVIAALRAAELTPVGGDLGTALLGRDLDQASAIAALAEAQDGYGELDCGRARPSAEHAALLLSARAAAGLDERARLQRAWAYVALCAEHDGDRSAARFAVERLRGLGLGGAGAEGLLPADIWARYPDVDASTDRDIVELTVTGPAGTSAWVDDRAIGATPATTFAAAGKHVVAVAAGAVRGATIATALGQPITVDVDAAAVTGETDVAATVRGWQAAGAVDPRALARIMGVAKLELAVAIGADGRATLWQRTVDKASDVMTGDSAGVATAARETWTIAHDRAPASGNALLHEEDVPEHPDGEKAPARWWVYAAIGGAVALGAIVIYAADAGEDRQRFQVTF